ncbi:hypothetical protein PILCRDRAFT_663480 [Piloderma croceum F 1598]|uniref:Uncharacterized protein n=1 Tax=Piloderma croceum (strain F 1598) TaxID=765440 RepID=A0A0C3APQ4_PILCF|nr:hypothetical protein PILCRDRAFT_663480 [Piloderma croceum F 1598]
MRNSTCEYIITVAHLVLLTPALDTAIHRTTPTLQQTPVSCVPSGIIYLTVAHLLLRQQSRYRINRYASLFKWNKAGFRCAQMGWGGSGLSMVNGRWGGVVGSCRRRWSRARARGRWMVRLSGGLWTSASQLTGAVLCNSPFNHKAVQEYSLYHSLICL